jgi:hypothetical protein
MRKLLVISSLVLLVIALAVESGSSWIGEAISRWRGESTPDPTGIAIPIAVAIDVALLARIGLTAFGNVISGWWQGKLDGLVTLIVGLVLMCAGIAAAVAAFGALMLMLGLFFSVPFGTAIYMAIFGGFARSEASGLLSLVMIFKIVSLVLFVLWNVRVVKSFGMVLLAASSLLVTALISLLHGIVPLPFVSITDAIGAIVVGIVTVIWGIVLLILGLIAFINAIRATVT